MATIGNFNPNLTLTENQTVLIDSDVTVTGTDAEVRDGRLVISGLLAEDRIGILNAGTITTSGANVLYDGTVIGTYAGGTGGSTFTVYLNANATVAGTDALIEHLTYSSISENPTASRALNLALISSDSFQPATDSSLADQGSYVNIALGDINGDGRPDIVTSALDDDASGNFVFRAYQQNVNGSYSLLSGANDPFTVLNSTTNNSTNGDAPYSTSAAVTLANIYGDSRPELIVSSFDYAGSHHPYLETFTLNGSGDYVTLTSLGVFDTLRSATMANIATGEFSFVTSGDFDKDGDVDFAVSGVGDGGQGYTIRLYQNLGNGFVYAGQIVSPTNKLLRPAADDIDGDGDVDLVVVANGTTNASVYLNNGNTTLTASSFGPIQATSTFAPSSHAGGFGVGPGVVPTFGDVDTDGDRDIVYGNVDGTITLQTRIAGTINNNPLTVNVTAVNDAPVNTVGGTQTFTEDAAATVVSGLAIADPDGGTATSFRTTLTTTAGRLDILPGGGASYVVDNQTSTSIITLTGTIAQINATLDNNITFAPNANRNGPASIAMTTSDGGASGGPAQSDTDTKSLSIIAVNDAPVVVNGTTTTGTTVRTGTPNNGDSVATLFAGHFSDTADNQTAAGGSSANLFAGVAIVANVSSATSGQWQYLNGATWTDIGAASAAAAITFAPGTQLRFDPVAGYNGNAPGLEAKLIESGGAAVTTAGTVDLSGAGATGGASHYSANSVTASEFVISNIAPVNTVPASPIAATEDTAVAITGVSVADTDTGDQLYVTLSVSAGGTLSLGTINGISVTAGANDTASFTVTATDRAQLNAALDTLSFTPTADYNGSPVVTVSTTDRADGTGLSDTDTITLNVAAVADIANDTLTVSEDAPATMVPVLANDSFENAGRVVTSIGGAAHGTVQLLNGVVTYRPTADYNGTDSFTYTVSSGGATETGTVNVTVNAVNDAPTLGGAGNTVGYIENGMGTQVAGGLTVSDVDNANLTGATIQIGAGRVTGDVLNFTPQGGISGAFVDGTGTLTLSGSASLASYQAALRSVTFSSSSDNPGSGNRTISFTATDGTDTSTAVTSTVMVTPVNDAPTLGGGGNTVGYVENGPGSTLNSAITVSDPDSATLSGATVSISGGFVAGDRLVFINTSSISGSYNTGTGVLSLNGTASLADYQAAFRSIQFYSTSDDPGAGSRTVSFTATDGALPSAPINTTVQVTPVNDAPVLGGAGNTVGFIENGSGVVVAGGLTLSDPDNANLTGASVRIVSGRVGGDQLGFINTASITGSYDGATGVLTLTGTATAAQYRDALRSVEFSSISENPGAGDRTVSFTATDGTTPSSAVTSTVQVTPVNDEPRGTSTIIFGTEDTPTTLTGYDFGFVDPDGNTLQSVRFNTLPNGSLTYNGTQVVINTDYAITATTGSFVFTPAANLNGSPATSLTFQVRDNGGTANGGVDLDQSPNLFNFNLAAVNDAPTVTITALPGATEQTADNLKGHVTIADVDAGAAPVTATLSVDTGSLTLAAGTSGATVGGTGTGSSVTVTGSLAQINALLNGNATSTFSYINNGDNPPASATLTVSVNDGGNTGGGALTGSATAAITITGVNDAPTGQNHIVTGSEDDPYVFTAADFPYTDPEGNGFAGVLVTSLPTVGTLRLGGAAFGPAPFFITAAQINAGQLSYLGAQDGYGTGYASFGFQIRDTGGSANNGADTDATTRTQTINLAVDSTIYTIGNVSLAEGDSGTTAFTFTVTRNGTTNNSDTLYLTYGGGTATLGGANADYNAGPASMTIAAGSATGTFTVLVRGDTVNEADETFGVQLFRDAAHSVPTQQAAGVNTTATGTILNDDAVFNIANVQLAEGDAGTTAMAFMITTDRTIIAPTSVYLTFTGGTATAGTDFDGSNQVVTFAPGDTSKTFIVPVSGDTTIEGNETFTVAAYSDAARTQPTTNSSGQPTSATGTILNDDAGYTIQNANTGEGDSGTRPLTFTVTRDTAGFATTLYAQPVSGTATAGSDFVAGVVPVTFAVGQTSATFTIPLIGDTVVEPTENFTVNLYNDAGLTLLRGSATGTIVNDDTPGTGGNDTVYSPGGQSPTLAGGDGNDTYVIVSGSEVIVDTSGYDIVYSPVSYALNGGAAIEVLSTQTQQGTDPINLIGNSFAQQVVGNFGDNVLNGNGGADTLIGLKGNDTYAIADANAVIVEQPGEGYDIVYTSVGYTLTATAAIEELSFTEQRGTANLNIIGNGFDQKVIGNFGNNVLNGNGGVDTLIGLKGDDIYSVGDARAVVLENGGEGNDTVYATVSYRLAAGQEIETLSAQVQGDTGALNFIGNEFGQKVIGNNGANLIDGGAGADTLIGLGGADTFSFSTALGNGNVDTIQDYQAGTDHIQLLSSVFSGLSAGTLASGAFVNGTTATAASAQILYNQATGQLYFDADGTGSGAAVLFATVTPGTALSASDFQVANTVPTP